MEITENAAPLVIWRKEYRPNSAGQGRYRGGVGQIMEFANSDIFCHDFDWLDYSLALFDQQDNIGASRVPETLLANLRR